MSNIHLAFHDNQFSNGAVLDFRTHKVEGRPMLDAIEPIAALRVRIDNCNIATSRFALVQHEDGSVDLAIRNVTITEFERLDTAKLGTKTIGDAMVGMPLLDAAHAFHHAEGPARSQRPHTEDARSVRRAALLYAAHHMEQTCGFAHVSDAATVLRWLAENE